MFAIYRQEFSPPLLRGACHQFPGSYQNLFIRQPNAFSRPDCLISCDQPCGSMRSRNYDINAGLRDGLDLSVNSAGYLNCPGYSEALKAPTQGLNAVRIPNDNQLRSEFKDLLGKQLHILTSTEGHGAESVSRVLDH